MKALPFLFLLLILSYQEVKAQLFQKTFQVNGRVIKIKDLNRQIEGILDTASLAGLSFAVIDHNKVVFFNTYGYKEFYRSKNGSLKGKGKVNKRTIFEACSLSKSFFVFAVYRLVDQGILDLDVPLYQYLSYPRLEYDDRYKKITARMVLSHTSGLENWQFYNDPARLEIINEPGEKFLYSGEGYVYLSKVVEKLLNKSIEEYMKELVFEPLQIKRTFTRFSEDGRSPGNYALGHDVFLKPVPKEKKQFLPIAKYINTNTNIASYINTTAKSYAQLLIAFFNGRFLSDKRMEDIIGPDTVKHFHYPETIGYNHWGPGFAVSYENEDTVVYQNGDNGAFKSFGFYSVSKKMGYAMFVNGELGDQIIRVLDSLTTGQHIIFNRGHCIFDDFRGCQYPSLMFKVLNVYNKQGSLAAINYVKVICPQNDSLTPKSEFNECAEFFFGREPELAASIALEYARRYPSAPEAFILHGKAVMRKKGFEEAINDFEYAIKLDNTLHRQLDPLISRCSDQLKRK
jgi:CubicO group peptidase (beta-lactamase class C family)